MAMMQEYRTARTRKKCDVDKYTYPCCSGYIEPGERYLPKKARDALSPAEYAATTRAKREGTAKGKQFVAQPKRIAKKTAKFRD